MPWQKTVANASTVWILWSVPCFPWRCWIPKTNDFATLVAPIIKRNTRRPLGAKHPHGRYVATWDGHQVTLSIRWQPSAKLALRHSLHWKQTHKQIRSYNILTKWCWINASPLYLKRLPIICYWKNQDKSTTQNQAQTQSMHNKDRRHCFSPASQMLCCQRSIGKLSEIEFLEERTNHYHPMLEYFGFEPICWPKIINNSW